MERKAEWPLSANESRKAPLRDAAAFLDSDGKPDRIFTAQMLTRSLSRAIGLQATSSYETFEINQQNQSVVMFQTNKKYISSVLSAAAFALLLAPAAKAEAFASDTAVSSFIVWCDCDTPIKKSRIEKRVRRLGGSVMYSYREFSALAVAARNPKHASNLKRNLEHIPGVVSVQDNEVMQLQTN